MIRLANHDRLHAGNRRSGQIGLHQNARQPHRTGPLCRLPIAAALRGASRGGTIAPTPFVAARRIVTAGDVRVVIVVQRLPHAREAVGEFRIVRQRDAESCVSDRDAAVPANRTIARAAAIAPITGISNPHGVCVPDGFRVSLKIGEARKIILLGGGLGGNLGRWQNKKRRHENKKNAVRCASVKIFIDWVPWWGVASHAEKFQN